MMNQNILEKIKKHYNSLCDKEAKELLQSILIELLGITSDDAIHFLEEGKSFNFKEYDIYKNVLLNSSCQYSLPQKCIGYNELAAYIEEPTDEEYNIIVESCYDAYLSSDYVSMDKLVTAVTTAYIDHQITLEEIQSMDRYDLANMQ